MRVPLIATLDANTSETRPFPALDSSSKLLFVSEDGSLAEYSVETVNCVDFLSDGRTQISFWLKEARSMSWKIYITDRRIGVWNSFTQGVLGKAKEKAGKASAGHIYFSSVANLSAFYDKKTGNPVLLVCCYRNDGTRTAITMQSPDIETMKQLATELYDRIDKWIVKNSRKLEKNESSLEIHIEALDKWSVFISKLWENQDSEVSTFVPCESWEQVPDSRVLGKHF